MPSPNRLPKSFGCPVELSIEFLRGKWKPVILARLKQMPCRYSELRRQIPELSDKVLTERLSNLEEQGLISRNTIGVYQLTPLGDSLRPVLQALYDWGAATAAELKIEIRDAPLGNL